MALPNAQLVFLPGLASNAMMWRHQLGALPLHWHASVSDVHFRHDSIEQMARALLHEIRGDLVLCGASVGSPGTELEFAL